MGAVCGAQDPVEFSVRATMPLTLVSVVKVLRLHGDTEAYKDSGTVCETTGKKDKAAVKKFVEVNINTTTNRGGLNVWLVKLVHV